jgi:hypothetical protein
VPRLLERRELLHPGAPHQAHVSLPALAVAPDGTPWLAWVRDDADGRHVQAARLASPGEPLRVRVDPDAWPVGSGHQPPGLAVGADGRAHVSWSSPRRDPGGSPFASDLVLASSQPQAPRSCCGSARPRCGARSARAVLEAGRRLGPAVVLSRGVHARGPQLTAAPDGGFVATWNEEEFPSLRTVVARLALAAE